MSCMLSPQKSLSTFALVPTTAMSLALPLALRWMAATPDWSNLTPSMSEDCVRSSPSYSPCWTSRDVAAVRQRSVRRWPAEREPGWGGAEGGGGGTGWGLDPGRVPWWVFIPPALINHWSIKGAKTCSDLSQAGRAGLIPDEAFTACQTNTTRGQFLLLTGCD